MPLKTPNFSGFGADTITVGTIESQDATSVKIDLGDDAGDDFIVDTNKLVVEGDSGRVGIGTAAPGATLGIDGDMHFQPTVTSTSHVTTAGSLDIRATDNIRIGTDGADRIRIGRENSSACKVHIRSGSNADLVVTDGKVGIGMEDPSDALEVDGDIQLTPTATSTAHLKTTGSLDVRASGNIRIGTDGADSVRLGRVNTTAVKVHLRSGTDTDMVLFNSQLGLGTETPGTQLQLEGTTPYVTLKNSTAENTAGGCESRIIFEDHGDNALGKIEVSHVGSSDDEKGQLIIKTNNDSGLQTALTISEAQVATFANTITCPGVDLSDGASINITAPPLPTTDHTATGLTADLLAGGPIAAFQTVCIHTVTTEVVISDADAIATMPVIGIATAAIADTNTGKVLLQGFIRDDTWNWTIGGILYADNTTAGGMTQTAPSGSGDFVQVLGVALSADVVYFNPSLTMVEVA